MALLHDFGFICWSIHTGPFLPLEHVFQHSCLCLIMTLLLNKLYSISKVKASLKYHLLPSQNLLCQLLSIPTSALFQFLMNGECLALKNFFIFTHQLYLCAGLFSPQGQRPDPILNLFLDNVKYNAEHTVYSISNLNMHFSHVFSCLFYIL